MDDQKTHMMKLVQGNEACAYGALHAGCSFFAGYPITPASEIMEFMARELPKKNGAFIQMEDEMGSLAAVIGASWAGSKAMTATSGPGFSLMQEHVGYAAMTETPCVIVNSQRGGPSTGLPTLPSQGDVMQARWGSHGDRPAIVLTASSVLSAYEMTVQAFNLSEAYRVPVVLLLDAVISHMRENVSLSDLPVVDRKKPADLKNFSTFGNEAFLPFGEGPLKMVGGLAHDKDGIPKTTDGSIAEQMLQKVMDRIDQNLEDIIIYDSFEMEDARWVILSYGITSRPAREAVRQLREKHMPVGLLDLKTLWPFPEELVQKLAGRIDGLLVPELNLGQIISPTKAAVEGRTTVLPLNRADGNLFKPSEIIDAIKKLMHLNGTEFSKPAKQH